MFHEVKIFDKKGKVKKVLSSNKLSTEYWNSFFKNSINDAIQKRKGREKKNKKIPIVTMKILSNLNEFNP
jgi:hypothetical protein